ncbi:hypothetical protein QBC37DRAFT_400305 [Rhypophila decipiens]|uniref:Glycoside hydrolase 131 catalytic N-terminal domain-containing protein n=1 Tax=Rhypophila decipiens TaxID=261697 RepID=A0AAN6Y8A9_9PEZI|nr:hypothetical protein QBC37DRAFT_400305 [Rhypophila decipiens]
MPSLRFFCGLLITLLWPLQALAQECTLQFDGRIDADLTAADFNDANDIFSNQFVIGQGLAFSQALRLLPAAAGSLFDIEGGLEPVQVLISDDSIFNNQLAFRRAELIPASNDGADASTQGVKTLHFSVLKDLQRPLNLSHEYQLVFLESADFSTNQFVLKTGTILGQDTADPDTLQLFGNVNDGQLLFSTAFTPGVFHNFALLLDFDASTTQVFFSTANDDLVQVTEALQNDLSGQGQFHFGVLKKPVNGVGDITQNGDQPDGINEGIIFGGVFQEDSSDGCMSLTANVE